MKWVSFIAGPDDCGSGEDGFKNALVELCGKVKEELGDKPVNLLLGFVAINFKEYFELVPEIIQKEISPDTFIGCSAGGLIGGGLEIEHKPSIVLTAAYLPGVEVNSFYLQDKELPDLDDSQESWYNLVGVTPLKEPSFIMLPEPFSFNTDVLIKGLDFAFPNSVKVGGLASGAMNALENGLFLNDKVYGSGLVGVSLDGNVIVDSVVAQGCKPVGDKFVITKCNKSILFELDGEPAVMALKRVIDKLSETEKELIKDSVFLGIVMNEMKESFEAGDFLIRNIIGIEPKSGALVVGEKLDNQKTVQFHVRDAATSADDLRLMLKSYKERELMGGQIKASGALLFSCLGRGAYLYSRSNHDSDCFRSYLGEVPIGGFFCNGEIGPVGESTFLHGYTSSFGIFRSRS